MSVEGVFFFPSVLPSAEMLPQNAPFQQIVEESQPAMRTRKQPHAMGTVEKARSARDELRQQQQPGGTPNRSNIQSSQESPEGDRPAVSLGNEGVEGGTPNNTAVAAITPSKKHHHRTKKEVVITADVDAVEARMKTDAAAATNPTSSGTKPQQQRDAFDSAWDELSSGPARTRLGGSLKQPATTTLDSERPPAASALPPPRAKLDEKDFDF